MHSTVLSKTIYIKYYTETQTNKQQQTSHSQKFLFYSFLFCFDDICEKPLVFLSLSLALSNRVFFQ